jgi:hypothetical protein
MRTSADLRRRARARWVDTEGDWMNNQVTQKLRGTLSQEKVFTISATLENNVTEFARRIIPNGRSEDGFSLSRGRGPG